MNRTMEKITEAVCEYFGLSLADLRGRSRPERISWPRMLAMALGVETGHTLSAAAGWFARHHSSAWHATQAVKDRVATCQQSRLDYLELKQLLRRAELPPAKEAIHDPFQAAL